MGTGAAVVGTGTESAAGGTGIGAAGVGTGTGAAVGGTETGAAAVGTATGAAAFDVPMLKPVSEPDPRLPAPHLELPLLVLVSTSSPPGMEFI